MNNKNRIMAIILIILFASLAFNFILFLNTKKQNQVFGVNSQLGFPCIYNASSRTLQDGQGTAISCDVNGNVIITN